jgi:hypothetical protein
LERKIKKRNSLNLFTLNATQSADFLKDEIASTLFHSTPPLPNNHPSLRILPA